MSPQTAVAAPVIDGRGLSKRFGAVQALADADLAVHEGEVVALVGENGAGKSTLVKILAGLLAPDDGELRVDGEPTTLTSARDAKAAGVRLAPQELQLALDISVTENLLLGELPVRGWPRRVDWAAAHLAAHDRLATLGAPPIDVRSTVASLSVVEKAFVQIARAMDASTRVMILDEPTAPMDSREVDQLLEVLRQITRSGTAVLYISHRLQEIFALCDRAVVLRDGAVVARFDAEEMTTDGLVDAMVSGRSTSFAHEERRTTPGTVPALAARDVRAGRVDVAALDIAPGEVAAIYGSLGSGREQIARVLVGLEGDLGSLQLYGTGVTTTTPAILRAGVGFVPAERRSEGLVLERPVRENLTLAMLDQLSSYAVVDRRRESRVVEEWMGALQIASDGPDAPVASLSGGSQQKVLLSRWLAAGSRVLVLEEPTRGVDVATKSEIYRTLHRHAAEGGAVLIVSSDIEEVARVSHRVLVMRRGAIVAELAGASESRIAREAMAA